MSIATTLGLLLGHGDVVVALKHERRRRFMLATTTCTTKIVHHKVVKTCVKRETYSVTRKDTTKVLALDPTAVFNIRNDPQFRLAILRCADYVNSGVKSDDDDFCDTPPDPKAHETPAETQKRYNDIDAKYLKQITEDKIEGTVVSLGDLKISVGQRSFESMIYYLSEVVRSQGGERERGSKAAPYQLTVLGRQPWGSGSIYEEKLFDLRRGAADHDAEITVSRDNGTQYWIAAFCAHDASPRPTAKGAARQCSVEYPENESLLVLTVMSELRGFRRNLPPIPSRPSRLAQADDVKK